DFFGFGVAETGVAVEVGKARVDGVADTAAGDGDGRDVPHAVYGGGRAQVQQEVGRAAPALTELHGLGVVFELARVADAVEDLSGLDGGHTGVEVGLLVFLPGGDTGTGVPAAAVGQAAQLLVGDFGHGVHAGELGSGGDVVGVPGGHGLEPAPGGFTADGVGGEVRQRNAAQLLLRDHRRGGLSSPGWLVLCSGSVNGAVARRRAGRFGTGGGGLCGYGGLLVGGRRGVFVVSAAGYHRGVDVGQRGDLSFEFGCARTGRGD